MVSGTTQPLSSPESPDRPKEACIAVAKHSALSPSSSHDGLSESQPSSGYFKSAAWTNDGTTIVTNSQDNAIRSFVLPVDLLSNPGQTLTPYATLAHPEPVSSLAIYPVFSLSNLSTTLVLTSTRDHPIRLQNALYPGLIASYPLIHPTTEAYQSPHSLHFTADGSHFIAGTNSCVSIFDLSRSGSGPAFHRPTIPSRRKKIVGGGVGMKGIVSALGLSVDGVLAAGTFTRWIGLYADEGRGDVIGVFWVADAAGERGRNTTAPQKNGIGGSGITQTRWSPDGRFLYVAERMSSGILMYDIRGLGKLLGILHGAEAMTQQRLDIDVVPGPDGGHEVWQGGTDGLVRVWSNPHHCEDVAEPHHAFAAHDDSVPSATMHPAGGILATCSGSRQGEQRPRQHKTVSVGPHIEAEGVDSSSPPESSDEDSEETAESQGDYSMKIWTV